MPRKSDGSNAATRAKNKYNAANYDKFGVLVPKGERARIDAAASKSGKSRNAFVVEAINEKIVRDGLLENEKEPRE
ncbi:hypothetical protein J6TS7_16030 [Paenibacillus dendritiformis]|uniref:transcriptional regulator n=1 Tax=Paenibacillus TaxID=44249 RepID=UPI001B0A0595|nr:transcriptional regulator [Paenibacillus dendritiformis]GIO77993.1 hypothetical protein J6TS7_16030 [Paenibacillus dendritiformis]